MHQDQPPNSFLEEDQNDEIQDGYVLQKLHRMGSKVLEAKCWHQDGQELLI